MSSKANTSDDAELTPDFEPAATEEAKPEPEVIVVNEPVDISGKPSFYEDGGIENKSETIVDAAIAKSKTDLEAEAAAAVVEPKPIPKHYIITDTNEGSAVVYEKDGNWLLEKVPAYTFKPKNINNNNEIPYKRCCLEKGTEPPSLGENIKAIYDVVIGGDSIPCNECDKNMCKETLLQWVTSIVVSLADAVKELSAVIPTTSSACGKTDAEALKLNTKGTHADLDDENPVPAGSIGSVQVAISTTDTAAEDKAPSAADMVEESQISTQASKMTTKALSDGSEQGDLEIELVEKPEDNEEDESS